METGSLRNLGIHSARADSTAAGIDDVMPSLRQANKYQFFWLWDRISFSHYSRVLLLPLILLLAHQSEY